MTWDFCCRHMKWEGAITFNGQAGNKQLKRQMGYVMQVNAHLSHKVHC